MTTESRKRNLGCLVGVLLGLLNSGYALAQTCVSSTNDHNNLNMAKPFKVFVQGSGLFGIDNSAGADGDNDVTDSCTLPCVSDVQLTDSQLQHAAILAAGIWNEHGNAGFFRFTGTTSLTDLADTEAGCTSNNTEYSLIIFTDDVDSNTALAQPECGGTQFKITVNPRFNNGVDLIRPFGNRSQAISTPPSGEYIKDVAGVLVHELGHVQDLGHPSGSEQCVMGGFDNDVRKRDLYEWDIYCSDDISAASATRDGTGVRVDHTSSGFSAQSAFSGADAVAKATAGLTFDSTTPKFSTAYHRGTNIAWDENADGSGYVNMSGSGFPSTINSLGFQVAYFREDSNQTDRIFYPFYDDDGTDFLATAVHMVRQGRSTDEFANTNWATLNHCTATSGSNCTASTPVYSRANLAVAYSESLARSIIGWIDADHSGDGTASDANEILISIGYMDDDTLAVPNRTGLYTAVPPSVACKDNFSGSYDCILAYVPMSDMTNPVTVARFSIGGSWPLHTVTLDGTEYAIGSSSGNQVAVWWHHAHSKFFVAYRTASASQDIWVRNSSAGTSWSGSARIGTDPITGPSAASTWNNSAMTTMPIIFVEGVYP